MIWRTISGLYLGAIGGSPKKAACANLVTPTCLSASHIAIGAIRIGCNFMELGQASAIAAVLAIENKTTIRDVDYRQLNEQLVKALLRPCNG